MKDTGTSNRVGGVSRHSPHSTPDLYSRRSSGVGDRPRLQRGASGV